MEESEKKDRDDIDVNIIGSDPDMEPIATETLIVGDTRNTFGRRLGILGFALIILFLAFTQYIQVARNSELLDQAVEDRAALVDSIAELSDTNGIQTQLIAHLQDIIREQNDILREAGLVQIEVPTQEN